MPRKAKELGGLAVSRLVKAGTKTDGTPKARAYAVGGVSGLCLQVLPSGGRSWLLRYSVGTKRRAMGLGPLGDVTLAMARDAGREARAKLRQGIDPLAERKAARSALSAAQGKTMTFKECAETYVSAHSAGWKNVKTPAQWTATLTTYAYPVIGSLIVSDVDQSQVMKILDPIWRTKTHTAKRLRGRIELILDWAAARQYRHGENPARWKGLLQTQLPAPSKVAKVKHHRALPVGEMGGFMKRLRECEGMGARALEFAILNASRSGEARGATWDEIDLAAKVWAIPAERMKAEKEHRVPLSQAAIELLEKLPRAKDAKLVFPAQRGGQLSDMTLSAVMRRMGVDAVPHGFRSTFRDWCSEQTNYPRDVAEMALAHTIGDKVEAAYRRGDLFTKRQLMMSDWADYCAKSEGATVISMTREKMSA